MRLVRRSQPANVTYLSGSNTGASKLQMYSNMHIQLLTMRIHIAVSERPM